jgi:hypothetical protein
VRLPRVLQVLLPQASLGVLAAAVLAAVVLSLLLEGVRDALRRRQLRVTGLKAQWLAKAETVAAAVRPQHPLRTRALRHSHSPPPRQARAKAAAGPAPTQKAKDWAERNVAGAASEEDASLIRGMNEFLQ